MSRRKPDKLDAMDAELIRETIGTPGWQLIKQGLTKMLERNIRDLVRPQTEAETAYKRGAIAALETAIKVPEILIQEGRNQDA